MNERTSESRLNATADTGGLARRGELKVQCCTVNQDMETRASPVSSPKEFAAMGSTCTHPINPRFPKFPPRQIPQYLDRCNWVCTHPSRTTCCSRNPKFDERMGCKYDYQAATGQRGTGSFSRTHSSTFELDRQKPSETSPTKARM